MIEIFAIYKFCKLLGKKLRAKGHEPLGLQILLVTLWIVFEIMGFFLGAVIALISTVPGAEPSRGMMYICGLIGAALGVTVPFLIAHVMKPKPEHLSAFPVEQSPPPVASQ